MNKITGFAVLNSPEGKRITYSYSVINETNGMVVESNVRRSFMAVDSETLELISKLETKVNTNLEAAT